MVKSEDLNYDLPIEVIRVYCDIEEKIVTSARKLINWIDIYDIEEYSADYEDIKDWKQFKDKAKCYFKLPGEHIVVLISFDEIAPLFRYYCRYVKKVDDFQYPNHIRTRTVTKQT